jgi:hypothetical protein
MRYAAMSASALLVAVSLVSFETPARAGNDGSAYIRGRVDAYQRGREDEWRRQQSESNVYRHPRDHMRLGQRYYEPDYGLEM